MNPFTNSISLYSVEDGCEQYERKAGDFVTLCRERNLPRIEFRVSSDDQRVLMSVEGLVPDVFRLADCAVVSKKKWKCELKGNEIGFSNGYWVYPLLKNQVVISRTQWWLRGGDWSLVE